MMPGRHIDGNLYMRIWDTHKDKKTLGIINRKCGEHLPEIPHNLREGRICCRCGGQAVYADSLNYIGKDRSKITLSETSRCYCQKCGDERSEYLMARDAEFNRIKIERAFDSAQDFLEANYIDPMNPEINAAISRAYWKAISGENPIKSCAESILSIFMETFFGWSEIHTGVSIPKKFGGNPYELDVSMNEFCIGIEEDGAFHNRPEEKISDRIKIEAKRELLSEIYNRPWDIVRVKEEELKKDLRNINYILGERLYRTRKALSENGGKLPFDFFGDINGNPDHEKALRKIKSIIGNLIYEDINIRIKNALSSIMDLIDLSIEDEEYENE